MTTPFVECLDCAVIVDKIEKMKRRKNVTNRMLGQVCNIKDRTKIAKKQFCFSKNRYFCLCILNKATVNCHFFN